MTPEELGALCQEAARDVVARGDDPLPATVVLPLPTATRLTALPDFPDDDQGRHDLIARFAAEVMRPANAPAWGFVGPAELATDAGPVDVVVVVYGARRHHPSVTAAPVTAVGLADFAPAEPLDPTAMPFLAPLQHAAEAATAEVIGEG